MRRTIQDQIILKTPKLENLEKQAHQWTNQALPSISTLDKICPHMRRLLYIADEKARSLGPDLENITDYSIQEKMLTLLSLTTLTIDIQNALQSWAEFQRQLAIKVEAIVEFCVQKRLSIHLHSP